MKKADKIAVILTALVVLGIIAGLILFCIFPEIAFLIVVCAIFYYTIVDVFIKELLYPEIKDKVYKYFYNKKENKDYDYEK